MPTTGPESTMPFQAGEGWLAGSTLGAWLRALPGGRWLPARPGGPPTGPSSRMSIQDAPHPFVTLF